MPPFILNLAARRPKKRATDVAHLWQLHAALVKVRPDQGPHRRRPRRPVLRGLQLRRSFRGAHREATPEVQFLQACSDENLIMVLIFYWIW
jgi:hypothetical protein